MPKTKEELATSPDVETQLDQPEMVEIHEADIDSLDAALANAQAEEQEAATEEVEVETEQPAEVPEPQPKPQAEPQLATAPAAPPTKPGVSAPSAPTTQGTPLGLDAENERLKTQLANKEHFIQTRGNELGALRKEVATLRTQLQTQKSQLEAGLNDLYQENPRQARINERTIEEIDARLEQVDQEEIKAEKIVEAQTYFLRHVDLDQVSLDDIGDMLRSDGIPDQYVGQFKTNPWTWTTPEALVQMGKRAMDRKNFVAADNDRRLLAKHVLQLNEQIKQLQGKAGRVLTNVQRGLNRPAPVTSATTATPQTARELDPTRMTTAELDQALQAAMRH